MHAAQWWTDAVRPILSQGDIIGPVPIVLPAYQTKYLKKATLKGSAPGWAESLTPLKEGDGRISALSSGFLEHAVVLSHDCEIDKPRENKSVLVAMVGMLSKVPPEHQDAIIAQSNIPRMYLPAVPSVGDCYANFRSIVVLDRRLVDAVPRLASMTDDARKLLQARIVTFFTRLEME